MDVTLTDPSALRILSRAVQAAAKLAEHVQFRPYSESLHFSLLTPTHSTYTVFRFNRPFFSAFTAPSSPASYKLSSRLLVPLLRAPHTISSLRLESHGARLRLTILTQSSLIKRFLLPLIEGRIASVHTGRARNELHTSAGFLSDVLTNFHAKLDEITLMPTENTLTFVSFVDDAANPANAFLRTELTVDARQFDLHTFVTGAPCRLTFLCRPLRVVIEFCDALDVPLRLAYDEPASPLQVKISVPTPSGDSYLDAVFIFSSRMAPNHTPQASTQENATPTPPHNLPVRPLNLQTPTQNPNPSSVVASQRNIRHGGQNPPGFQSPREPSNPLVETPVQNSEVLSKRSPWHPRNQQSLGILPVQARAALAPNPSPVPPSDSSQYHRNSHEIRYEQEEEDHDEDEDDFVAGTPPPIETENRTESY